MRYLDLSFHLSLGINYNIKLDSYVSLCYNILQLFYTNNTLFNNEFVQGSIAKQPR